MPAIMLGKELIRKYNLMILHRAPLIVVGQIYLNADIQEYLIVTNNNRGQISYQGVGFTGQAEDETFIERFAPVDPEDVDESELAELVSFCPAGTQPLVGFITD
jgi:hypothetical protein